MTSWTDIAMFVFSAVICPLMLFGIFHRQLKIHKIQTSMKRRNCRSEHEIEGEVRILLEDRNVNVDNPESLQLAMEAWRLVAEEVEVNAGFLRPDDCIHEICLAPAPFLANVSADELESHLGDLQYDAELVRNQAGADSLAYDRPSEPIQTVGDFIVHCAGFAGGSV